MQKDFLSLARERYSVRQFEERQIEPEKMDRILEAGRIAPTAANHQPFRIYILQSRKALQTIRAITPCAFNAPTVLLMTYNVDEEWKNAQEEGIASGQEDVSIVATHMMLEAWELGIGSCWVNAFPNSKAAEAFHIPSNEKVVLLMPLGYADPKAAPSVKHTQRRALTEVVTKL